MISPMRVLYLAPSAQNPKLLSRRSFLDEEIRALADAGVEAYVISASDVPDDDTGRIHIRAVPADSTSQRWRTAAFAARRLAHVPLANLHEVRQLYRAARIERFASEVVERDRIELIHSYFGWPLGFGGLLTKAATGTPLVANLRGVDVNVLSSAGYGSRRDPFFDRAFRRLLADADATLYHSEFLRANALRLGASPATARLIRKGVRLDLFRPDARQNLRDELHLGPAPIILAAGGLVRIKGFDCVLHALARLRSADCQFTFVVCGDGPERGGLEALAKELGLGACTMFLGHVVREQMAKCFAGADLFVHGALIEAAGNVLLEAMASALPVVCTNAGGPAEYVQDGRTGFVVPVGDPESMSDRLGLLLRDAALRKAMGRNGRAYAETHFDYTRMIHEMVDMYRTLLHRTHSSPPAPAPPEKAPAARTLVA